jgi:hypothetical protein
MADRERPTIYVLSPDIESPTGGIKVLYRHVDILNAHGFDASIMHQNFGFRCTWFDNTTRVSYAGNTELKPNDFLVFPEVFGPGFARFAPGVRKVVYNQSGYLTFQGYPIDGSGDVTPYLDPDVVATFSISENAIRYMNVAFPDMRVFRMHWSLDASTYSFVGPSHKKRQICFMPRRHPEDAIQVFNMLKFHGALRDFSVVPIHDMSAQQAADVMGQSMIFFAFGYPEGCPLPPAEAMARGCVVVGYHGWGGLEYFKPGFSYPIDAGDILGFVASAEKVLDACRKGDPGVLEKGRAASKFIRKHYSREIEENDVIGAWTELVGGGPAA